MNKEMYFGSEYCCFSLGFGLFLYNFFEKNVSFKIGGRCVGDNFLSCDYLILIVGIIN